MLHRGVQDRCHVPDPDVGVEEEDRLGRLLAQRHGQVHSDGRLADAPLGSEDADHLPLPHLRRLGLLGGGRPLHVHGKPVAPADEERLQSVDEGIRRAGLGGVLVTWRAPVGRFVREEEECRDRVGALQLVVHDLRPRGIPVGVDHRQRGRVAAG
jgi:hypothetical protein